MKPIKTVLFFEAFFLYILFLTGAISIEGIELNIVNWPPYLSISYMAMTMFFWIVTLLGVYGSKSIFSIMNAVLLVINIVVILMIIYKNTIGNAPLY